MPTQRIEKKPEKKPELKSEKKTVAPKRTRRAARVDPDAVARLAYARFEARGRTHGHDVEDWLSAERELAE